MSKAVYILLAGRCQGLSSAVPIPVGEARRIGIYTDTVGASLDGYRLLVFQETPCGSSVLVDCLGENKREEIYYGPAVVSVSRPDLSGEGCGVYMREASPDEWMLNARPCYSISDL